LAELAKQLDEEERRKMGNDQRFLSQPSANMDDTGFFSVQVLQRWSILEEHVKWF
jgi:hypothetical protein